MDIAPLDVCERIPLALNALRGMIELLVSMYQQSRSWPYRALRRIPNPGWAIAANSKQKELNSILFHPHEIPNASWKSPHTKFTKLSYKQMSTIAGHLERDIGNPSSSDDTRWLMADVLRLYSQAMDSPHEHDCFLGFWRCAERLTLADDRDSNKTVIARLVAVLATSEIDTTGMTTVLTRLSHMRNDYVHRGIVVSMVMTPRS